MKLGSFNAIQMAVNIFSKKKEFSKEFTHTKSSLVLYLKNFESYIITQITEHVSIETRFRKE